MKELSAELLDQIVERLVDALRPEKVYLFGSHAYGSPHRDSDLDLLVVVPDDAGNQLEVFSQGMTALRGMAVPVDLVVFHRRDMEKWAPIRCSLPHAAVSKGRLLYAA
jgi:predicted nucleotidyltransferase